MSSDANFVALLQSILTNLYKFGGFILMSLGTLGCIISLIVFTRKNLRRNPCAMYYVAVNVGNLLLIYASFLPSTLHNAYNIDPSVYSLWVCRCRSYTVILFDALSPIYLIFASIDRVLLTSPNARTRQRSTVRLAYICIICITLSCLAFYSHSFVFADILQLAPGFFFCYFQLGLYALLMSYYLAIVKGILVPLSMLLLGLWTVRNVRNVGRVVPIPDLSMNGTAATGGMRSPHSKDRQLIRILLIDISIYIIFNVMISVVLVYQQMTQHQTKSYVQARIASFLVSVGVFSAYVPFCIGCYTNLLVSKTFRHEVNNVLRCR